MRQYKVIAKANYLVVSLFAFLLFSLSVSAYADEQQDIAELEAFYHLVFKDENHTKAPAKVIVKPKSVKQKKKQIRKTSVTPQQNYSDKDPELVAFYESVFGKLPDEVQTIPNNKSVKSNKTPAPPKKRITKQLNKPKKVIINNPVSNDESEVKVVVEKNFQGGDAAETEVIVASTNQDSSSSMVKPIASESQENNIESTENVETGILDKALLSSQVQETDTKSLFAKAFGKPRQKKNRKTSKTTSTQTKPSKRLPANDMATLFAKAFGGKSSIPTPSQVTVDFRVNSSIVGEAKLFSNNSGVIDQIETKSLLIYLEEVLKDPVFITIKPQLVGSKKTSFSALNKIGISTFYNSTNLSLDIDIKPEFRKPQILSLLRKKKASVREENIIEANKVSGYLNAFTNIGVGSQNSNTDVSMRLEGSLNIGKSVLETTTDYRNDSFNPGRTTLTYDRPDKLQRLVLGNISTGSRNFQENLELDGIRFSKEFFLDPNLQISPRANEALVLDSESEVEVYVNNRLLRRFFLKEGVYSLEDIGLYNGANNIRIRIKDEFGKVTVKRTQQYFNSHLLKPGFSLFAMSVGYLSNKKNLSNKELENTPIFSGYYQKGLNKELTLSFDGQFSSDNFLFGAESISSIAMGSVLNSVAISGGKQRNTGFATSFEFKPNRKEQQFSLDTLRNDLLELDTRSRGLIKSWSITGEYRSEDFLLLNGINPNVSNTSQEIDGVNFGNRVFNSNRLRSNVQTNFSLNISDKWNGTLNLGAVDYYDSDDSYYANLSANRRFENGIRLNVGTRYDSRDKLSMNLQISIPLSRKKGKKKLDLDLLTDSRNNAYETKLSLRPSGYLGKNSLSGNLKHFENNTSRQESLDIKYRNPLFESTLAARSNYTKGSQSSSQRFNLGLNTSIACVGTNCASSYPIDDSFALVKGPSNQTNPIALNNNNQRFRYSDGNDTGLPDNYSGLITSKGKTAVVQLDSYRTQNINIDEGTLPNGYDSEKTEFSMFPHYHQGFLLKAGGEPATTLDGMLFDSQNKGLSFKGGQWIPENKGKTIAFFSNKAGRFRVSSIPAGKYKLELFDYPDMEPISVLVPETKGKVHNIGKLIIKTPNQ